MKPLLLHYYITNRCNAKCTFCDIWEETPKKDASTEDVLSNLREAKKAGCKFVDFTGGEPLLNKDLPLFLSEAKKLGFITSITTNCILFPKMAENLSGLIDLLHFSLDADKAELHDKLHGVKSFDKILESISISKQFKLFPDLLFTYTNENIDHFEGVYKIAKKNRLMVILDPVFSLDGKDINTTETHSKALKWARKPGIYLNRAHLKLRTSGGNSLIKPLCKAVSSTLVVLPDNTLALPCYHQRNETIKIKNLTTALKDPRRKVAIKHEGKYPFCHGCHINCYFDPSYSSTLNRYFFSSILSKIEYSFDKYLRYKQKMPSILQLM